MAQKTNSLERFWKELKRRKVFSVVTTYAATGYIIIEVVNNLIGPLHLPDWLATLVVTLLIIGLPLVIILSWIFDFTPQGIKKTESIEELEGKEVVTKPVKRKLRVSYVLNAFLIIAVLVLVYREIMKQDMLENLRSSDGKISVAVMPFKNLTTDSILNIWQSGLQNLLITSLSNSEELSVRQFEIMDEILKGSEHFNYASITPTFASNVALKLEANTVVLGNVYKTGKIVCVTANLMDSKTEEIYKSFEIKGNTEDDFFPITDSIANLIMNYLQIKKLEKKYKAYDLKNVYTSSAESFKYYIQGRGYHGRLDYSTAIDLYLKSINLDTNFVNPMLMLSYAYGDIEKTEESRKWAYKAYNRINSMPYGIQLQIGEVKAAVDKEPHEQIKYLKQYLEFNPYSTIKFYTLGWVSYNIENWKEAIYALEKGLELNKRYSPNYKLWIWHYIILGNGYLKTGEYEKAMKIYEKGIDLWPNEILTVTYWQSICTLLQGDFENANQYLSKIRTIGKQKGFQESEITERLAGIYYEANLTNKAEEYYRQALSLEPSNPERMNSLAYFLINSDRDIKEGLGLISKALELSHDEYYMLETKGWGLFKQGRYNEALELLNKSWDLSPFYSHDTFLHLEAAKKAVAGQKAN